MRQITGKELSLKTRAFAESFNGASTREEKAAIENNFLELIREVKTYDETLSGKAHRLFYRSIEEVVEEKVEAKTEEAHKELNIEKHFRTQGELRKVIEATGSSKVEIHVSNYEGTEAEESYLTVIILEGEYDGDKAVDVMTANQFNYGFKEELKKLKAYLEKHFEVVRVLN